MMGYTSQEGYEHEASKAIRGDKFCALLCDEINQDDLSAERVENWVAQLRADGFLEGSASSSGASDSSAETSPAVDGSVVAELQKENADLRKMLEENSKLMDEVMKDQKKGYTPHYNAKTKVTMWTSGDGKRCYYTTDQPKSP